LVVRSFGGWRRGGVILFPDRPAEADCELVTGRQHGHSAVDAGVAAVAEVLPVFGFYIQPAIGGRRFGYEFWRAYAEIAGVAAIKIAPFDRYATIELVRAVVDSGRADDIALYTGNDDNIVVDLLTPYRIGDTTAHIVGGLLGQWAVGTAAAVALHAALRGIVRRRDAVPLELLTQAAELTDMNGAAFDVAHRFKGSIAGINEILTRSGLLEGNWCLSTHERLSPGQSEEIDRTLAAYPWIMEDVQLMADSLGGTCHGT
jgi:hypothetical protein